jgi:hypothetical protein
MLRRELKRCQSVIVALFGSLGLFGSPNGKKYPRVLTIAGLLDNTQHAEHPDYEPDLNFKKAKAEVAGEQAVAHLKAEILLVTRASRPLRSFGFAP